MKSSCTKPFARQSSGNGRIKCCGNLQIARRVYCPRRVFSATKDSESFGDWRSKSSNASAKFSYSHQRHNSSHEICAKSSKCNSIWRQIFFHHRARGVERNFYASIAVIQMKIKFSRRFSKILSTSGNSFRRNILFDKRAHGEEKNNREELKFTILIPISRSTMHGKLEFLIPFPSFWQSHDANKRRTQENEFTSVVGIIYSPFIAPSTE